ncbi:cytochrome c biogenesis protein ResB [Halobacteriovorax sp. HLS]|uniref:cytochrome c biogenesis protein ResB n=1 Tax=Halobacteriovorax sp. HLS TaxID=2234000 RepID=UPI000FD9DFF9|nr:cytochrome c biogenesis protein ResB [Halobacteriovorax sp. HLS]
MSFDLQKKLGKTERFFGGLKFAVIVISIFSVFMIIGTFFESYYGTDFANRVIYKRFPFMFLQFGMFISIFFAMLLRLPPKKRLYGFYTIHTGLIMIACGSFVTWFSGIDGHLNLDPNSPNRKVVLSDDILRIIYHDEGKTVTRKLPYTAFSTTINDKYEDIEITDFYPFAQKERTWATASNPYPLNANIHSSTYIISNPNVSQEITLSLHPEATEFEASVTLGPLNVTYLPKDLAGCFALDNKSGYIVWDSKKNECYTPEQRNIEIKQTSEKNKFLVIREEGKLYSFFPDFNPWPIDSDLEVIKDSHLRIFSKKLFQDKPNLFLFGREIAYYSDDKWTVQKFKSDSDILELPWMGFELILKDHEENKFPSFKPVAVRPIQKNGQLIKGQTKAIQINVLGKKYWVLDDKPITLRIKGKKVSFVLDKEILTLPFEFVLTKFKMDKDPGTNKPASYESFVRMFTSEGPTDHHVFMNNPLKHAGFTFYQASYSQDPETGRYSSTLSVNVDQGRPLKYLGSLLLVLGAMGHYFLNKKKSKKSPDGDIIKLDTKA